MGLSARAQAKLAGRTPDARARVRAIATVGHDHGTLPVLSAGVGALAWSGHVATLPLALALPILWTMTPRRAQAGGVALAYYLAASRGLPEGAATYFGQGLYTGLVLWALAGVVLALSYVLLWRPDPARRVWRLPLLLLIVAVPPIGIVGWAHPLTAAGVLLPGTGGFGLVLTLVIVLGLAARPRLALVVVPLLLLVPWVVPVSAPPSAKLRCFDTSAGFDTSGPPPGWQGIDTRFPFDAGARDFYRDYLRQLDLRRLVRESPAEVVVLPESAAGRWNEETRAVWEPLRRALGERTVLMGAERLVGGGAYENVIVRLDKSGDAIVYRQRQPVPLTMWRPWDTESARAAWDSAPVFELAGRRVAPLICYEQLLIWPVLQSMWHRPEVLLAVGNGGWAAGTSIPAIQSAAVTAWAALFGTALITSTNL